MRRWPLIAVLTVVVLAASIALVVRARSQRSEETAKRKHAALAEIEAFNHRRIAAGTGQEATSTTATPTTTPAVTEPKEPASKATAVENGDLLVLSTVPGPDYGSIQIIGAGGERLDTGVESRCDRVHAGGGYLVCLATPNFAPDRGVAIVRIIRGTRTTVVNTFQIGLPSRARVAPDGSWASISSFVTGHSYLQPGQFATQTVMFTPTDQARSVAADRLEVSDDDPRFFADDGNWWGGTFVPGDPGHLLMTYGSGGKTEVMRVDATTGKADPYLPVGGCPSVSPDGRYVVFKAPVPGADAPALLVLHDLRSGAERVLGETRFVDDQPEWLDDHTLAYAMVRKGTPKNQPASDVWSLDIAPGSKPKVLVPFATSPVRYRDTRPAA